MNQPLHKCSDGNDHSLATIFQPALHSDAGYSRSFTEDLLHHSLLYIQPVLGFQRMLHLHLIMFFIHLRSQSLHRRSFAEIKHPYMRKALIYVSAHFAAQSINFSDKLGFGGSSYGAVARQKCYTVKIDGQQKGGTSHSSRSQGRFASGMAGTYNDNIISFFIDHNYFPTQKSENILSTTSSVVVSPVISPSASAASCRSTAVISAGCPQSMASLPVRSASVALTSAST